ncbi:hypothetical protein C0991_001967 [Blastosporella zonata]|nr:hypothetical protein C0991_001967 [Blastosporella zonata]
MSSLSSQDNKGASKGIDDHPVSVNVDEVRNPERRQIGLVSAVFIIFNRIIGTGVFATPSTILGLSGSVGLSLFMWVIGAIIAAAGMQVYIIWGTAVPKNGGEKNYLEYLFRKPKYLMTSMFAANGVLLAWAAGNSLVFGQYILLAANVEPGRWTLRLVGFACITFALLIHGTALKWGLRLQNFLGIVKIIILIFVIITGFVALGGHMNIEKPHNFRNAFEGTNASASSFCLSLYNVIWSYIGFSNVNYALGEVKDPKRTVRIAGPLAIAVVTVLYLLANIAYFAGASKEDITTSGQLVAALLFRNVYGPRAERALSAIVALSALGNVLAVIFSQGRVNQELGREGILPCSKFWGSNRPFNAPLTGLALHWIICLIVIFALPPGDAYNFVINVISYPLSVINATISFGIIYLSFRPRPDWPKVGILAQLAAAFFGAANTFLFVVPLTKPPPGAEPYVSLPYWTHAVAGWAVFGLGFLYWVIWAHVLPRVGRYELVRSEEVGRDGLSRHTFRNIAHWDLNISPGENSTDQLVFDTVNSLLQHWPNTRYRNEVPTVPEWLATDPEHSYLFCRGSEEAGCWHHTFVTTRPMKILYFDGSSAAKMQGGPMDSQDIVLWGEVKHEWTYQERKRIDELCAWGKQYGLDGFARMEQDFEIMHCDFQNGLQPVSKLNLASVLRTTRPLTDPPATKFNDYGRLFTAVLESGSWHNHYPGEPRFELDLSRIVSFYDTKLVPSLIPSRLNRTRFSHRLENISSHDVQAVMRNIAGVLSKPGPSSGIDWRGLFRVITLRYADRLEVMQHHFNSSDPQTASRTPLEIANLILQELRMMLAPYILHSAVPQPSRDSNSWASPVYHYCATTHTDFISSIPSLLTPSERFLLKAIRGTNREICRVIVKVWAEAVVEGLDPALPVIVDVDDKRLKNVLAGWESDINGLMSWLDWSIWIKCKPACSFEAMCYLPTWPFFRQPQGGDPHRRGPAEPTTGQIRDIAMGITSYRGQYPAAPIYITEHPGMVLRFPPYLNGSPQTRSILIFSAWRHKARDVGISRGSMDSQDILLWGEVRPEWTEEEEKRINELCAWGKDFGIDAFVRMSFDFEIMMCDFSNGLQLVSKLQVVSPIIYNDPSGDPRQAYMRDRAVVAAVEAGALHNFPGDPRIQLDLSRLVSFYDTELVPSLILSRFRQSRFEHRLQNISSHDVQAAMNTITGVLTHPEQSSGIDWKGLFRIITLRYSDRLQVIQHHLNATEVNRAPHIDTVGLVLDQLKTILAAYLLHSAVPSLEITSSSSSWAAPVFQHCATTPTDFATSISSELTYSERLLLRAAQGTNREICRVVVKILPASI